MKKNLLLCLLSVAASVVAESSFPPAPQILAAARAQLPSCPVVMKGTLKQRADNGFIKKSLEVEMEIDWKALPPRASYRISDSKSEQVQTLGITWNQGIAEYSFTKNGEKTEFNPNADIENIGITWSDLSFSFLWDPAAKTLGMDKKFGKERYKISIPRPDKHALLLWIEKETGRMVKAEEIDDQQKQQKILKVVSVKEFNGLWMVKDLDIIRPATPGRTTLRIDSVDTL